MEAIKKVKDFPYCREARECAGPQGFHQGFSIHFIFVSLLTVSGGLWEVHEAQSLAECPTSQTQV